MAEFVSEPLRPDAGTADLAAMARGEPGLPKGFTWRGKHYAIVETLTQWKTNSDGEGQVYLRRHWYQVRTDAGVVMTIHCLRQVKRGGQRWWVYRVDEGVEVARGR